MPALSAIVKVDFNHPRTDDLSLIESAFLILQTLLLGLPGSRSGNLRLYPEIERKLRQRRETGLFAHFVC